MIANVHAERVVLGTILTEPKASFAVSDLATDDFAELANRTVFEAISAASSDGKIPSPTLVAPALAKEICNAKPAMQYVMELARLAVGLDEFQSYLQALREFAGRRRMQHISAQMAEVAKDPKRSILPFNEDVTAELNQISAGVRNARITCFDLGELAAQKIEAIRSGKQSNLIRTGLSDLDREIGGWSRGELSIIAGRSSMGKTTVALSSLRQAAARGVTSIFFSLEMPGDKVAARMLSDTTFNSQTPIPYTKIIRHEVTEWDLGRLDSAADRLRELPMRVDSQRGLNVNDISVRARRYQDELDRQGRRLDVICVDHIGFVKASQRYAGNRTYELGEISSGFKELSERLDCAIILLCQLNREAEKRDDKRPQLSDLRESGRIEEDADTVIFAYRRHYYLSKIEYKEDEKEQKRLADLEASENVIELLGLKTRNGPTFSRRFFADMASNVIRDAA
jgi:replicative DNA helicase